MWLASLRAFAATAAAASFTEEPAVTVCRLAKPPSPSGAAAVSPAITATLSALTPKASAQICASAVASPCPIGAAPVDTVIWPLGDTRTLPNSNGPRPVP